MALGLRGGSKGGHARAASTTAKQRQKIARDGASARWGKQEKSKNLKNQQILEKTAILIKSKITYVTDIDQISLLRETNCDSSLYIIIPQDRYG